MRSIGILVVVAAVGCKKQASKDSEQQTSRSSQSEMASEGGVTSKTVLMEPKYSATQKCAHPELFLLDTELAKLPEGYKKACPDDQYHQRFHGAGGCRYKDYARNAIYAAYGKKFTKPKWQKLFAMAKWYKVNEAFSDKMLSKTAFDNVAALKKSCEIEHSAQFKADKKLAQAWLESLRKDQMTAAIEKTGFPHYTFGETLKTCEKLTAKDKHLKKCLHGWRDAPEIVKDGWTSSDTIVYSYETPFYYKDTPQEKKDAMKDARFLKVNFVPSDLACDVDIDPAHSKTFIEDCGGYGLATTLAIKDGKVVGSHWFGGAACPFVYTEGADGRHFVGEVLRNLSDAGQYGEQTLALAAPALGQPLVVHLTEEKREVSFVDELYLRVDGKRFDPPQCQQQGPAYCQRDRRFAELSPGESLRLVFSLPAKAKTIELVVTGYYQPLW